MTDYEKINKLKTWGFDAAHVMERLETLPEMLSAAGSVADQAKAAKLQLQQSFITAKNTLELKKASVVMQMPDTLKNEMQRNAYLNEQCSSEVMNLAQVEGKILEAEINITNKMRDFYTLSDHFDACKAQAELLSSLYKYLSVV